MHTFSKKQKRTNQGFSLIELMVSLTIFSIVMTTSVGTLLVMIDANAKAQSLYSVMTNLSFAVDSITRNLRTGNNHYCYESNDQGSQSLGSGGQDCASGDSAVAFNRMIDNERIGYRLNETNHSIEQKQDTGSWLKITSDDVTIDTFVVTVLGSERSGTGDAVQPEISLLIEGYLNNGLDTATDFSLQSKVTKRILDF